MAVDAGNRLMRAVQIVFGIPAMVEQPFRPVGVVVAAATVVAVMPTVLVIFQMTGHAGLVHFILKRIFRVAITAGQLCVFSLKHELGVPSMIESGVVPVGGVMAGFALLSASTVVRIVLGMTTKTCGRRILIGRILVAIETRSFLMLAKQRVVGCIVIKCRVCPFSRQVTVSAIRPERFFMSVVIAVTIIAGARRVAMQSIGSMAIGASRLQVCSH
jgi:hypothetical protein